MGPGLFQGGGQAGPPQLVGVGIQKLITQEPLSDGCNPCPPGFADYTHVSIPYRFRVGQLSPDRIQIGATCWRRRFVDPDLARLTSKREEDLCVKNHFPSFGSFSHSYVRQNLWGSSNYKRE